MSDQEKPVPQYTDPNYDEDNVWRAQRAMNLLIQACQNVVTRYSENGHWYVIPDPYTLGGSSGIMHIGRHQVLMPLQDQIDKTLATFAEIDRAMSAHRQQQLAAKGDSEG